MQIANIMVVDDHPIVRSGFRQLIQAEPSMNVCCEAASIKETLLLLKSCTPDLAVIDLSLPDGNGLDLIKRILARQPNILILVSSMHDEELYMERSLYAGAKGYINKQEAGEQVVNAIKQILKGEFYISPMMLAYSVSEKTDHLKNAESMPFTQLSNRELEVFELIGKGIATGKIADMLSLSVKTIESHRANIKAKLNLQSASELTHCAIQWTLNI